MVEKSDMISWISLDFADSPLENEKFARVLRVDVPVPALAEISFREDVFAANEVLREVE